jgi:putative Mg2+ transporter-C (MgtC) family protein
MPLTLDWQEIAIRLILTAIAGSVIGINRGGHGHPAGLRTTLLVCMAASIAMIQTNLLLGTVGRPSDSFVNMDLMRLPLGILSGMGFIGGGVILKRDNLVLGVTTAATLWFVTIIGLCFGGGQKVLGLAGLAIGVAVLWGLKGVEIRMAVDRTATLVVRSALDRATEQEIHKSVRAAGFEIIAASMTYDTAEKRQEIRCDVRWHAIPTDTEQPRFLSELLHIPGISKVDWNPKVISGGLP